MKILRRWWAYVLVGMCISCQSVCKACLFEMSLQKDGLFSPGTMDLDLHVTDEAVIRRQYQFKVSIFAAGALVRQQILPVLDRHSVAFELEFPEVLDRTAIRCRAELSLAGDFLEARELPLTLWPPLASYAAPSLQGNTLWIFDTSGRLQIICKALRLSAVDATFQPARDFTMPDLVVIGEHSDPNQVRLVTERFKSFDPGPVLIFLKQTRFMTDLKIRVPAEVSRPRAVMYQSDSPLLKALSPQDLLALVTYSVPIQMERLRDDPRRIQTHVWEASEGSLAVCAYLCTIRRNAHTTVYCQLPASDPASPRDCLVLTHVLQYAIDMMSQERKL